MEPILDHDIRLREIFAEYEIIDAHVHPPTPLPKTDYSLFKQNMTGEQFVAELRRTGISRCCGSVIRAVKDPVSFEEIHVLNTAALDFREKYPDFYIPGISVHPAFPEESCAEIETMYRDHGVRFVGELVPYAMSWKGIDIPAMDPVWDLIQQKELAVNVHLGELREAAAILKRFPKLKFIIAHPTSSYQEYLDRIDLIAQYENAALDISGSGPNSWGMVRYALNRAGTNKILFGSDFPIRNPGMYIAGVLFEHLTKPQLEAVFSRNFKNLVR